MHFVHKKLPLDAGPKLRISPLKTIRPFALLHSPAYVLMTKNQRYICIKTPFDYFAPADLERLKSFEYVYYPAFIDHLAGFIQAAQKVRAVLSGDANASALSSFLQVFANAPTPYEVSDAVLRIIGVLVSSKIQIEPFFMAVFANELCDLDTDTWLEQFRSDDVQKFETAVCKAGALVFLALMYGQNDLGYLNRLRRTVIESEITGATPLLDPLMFELRKILGTQLSESMDRPLLLDQFLGESSSLGQRLSSRIKRIRQQFIQQFDEPPTIMGSEGIAHD